MLTDPIADMLTRIRNAQAVGKENVSIPLSKAKLSILKILKEKGYILDFIKNIQKNNIILKLRYSKENNTEPAIKEINKISKAGRRIYKSYKEFRRVKNGLGMAIVSTSRGVMADSEARNRRLGGEIICEVF